MSIQTDAYLLVNREGQSYKFPITSDVSGIADTDWLIVNRNNQSYKVSGAVFKSMVKPQSSAISTPVISNPS